MKKILFTILEAVLFLAILYVLIINYKANATSQFCISYDGTIIILDTFFVILAAYFLGVITGGIYSLAVSSKNQDLLEFFARKTEKLSQQNEIDTDEKEALQRKIASLEIALNNALKNK